MFFQSNGKILLSSEYLVLDGAKSIALPSKKTQELHVTKKTMDSIVWKSYDHNNNLWFEEVFKLKKNKLSYDGEKNIISEKLLKLFNHIHKFKDVSNSLGNQFITKLNFDRNWGLGTSSTFVNNLAKWAEINAYELLYSSFKGSGYDIACCDKNCPITYSNLDNNPAVVGRSGRRRGKAKERMEYVPEDEPAQIFLSNKTGLPLGVLPTKTSEEDRWDGDDTFVSINKGEARLKSESKAEKKARKAAVKEERRVARMQKKMMKEAFAEEFERRAGDGGDNDLAGKSVFRIA